MTGGFDPAMPNTARVYSRLLGGKDHFPADRAEADLLLEIYPPLAEMVRENRAFIAEAVTWAASRGVGQFIDLGAGLPASPAVHQTARAVLPGARVAYVDLDPMVLSHARALLAGPGVAAVAADLRDPAAVLADQELRAVIDPAEPVCVILGAVLHFLDADTAREVTAGYARLIAPGSYLVISCAAYDDEALAKRLASGIHRRAVRQPHQGGRRVVLRRAGPGRPGRHRGADLAAVAVPAGAAAPRGSRAGRRGPSSTLTSSASLHGAGISGIRDEQPSRRCRGASRSAACTCR